MIAHVSSGMYRVTAYAGEEREWSANSKKHPLYLIRDMPSTASTGALAAEISPIGHNHYVVPGEVSRVLVETPEKVSLHLQVGPYTEENPYQRIIAEDSIHVKANAPRCMVNVRRNRASFYRIKVSGTPGQSFKLQTLTPYKSTIDVDKAGNYWLSTIHTGDPADQIGASGVLLKQGRDRDYQIIAGQLDTLSSDRPIVRRFNLLDNMDLYLWVAEAGEYTIAPDGVEVEWRVERSYYDRPPNYQSPSSVRGEGSVDLQRGLHQLKLNPLRKGVLTLQIKHSSLFSKLKDFAAQITAGDDTTLATGLPRIQFPSIYLKDGRDERYVFLLNNQSPEMAGVILRPLPINLSEPLSIYISPQQEIRIPIQVPQKMQLSITDLKQKHYSFKLNGVRYQSPYVIDSGQYSLTIENPSSQHRFVYAHTYEPEMLPDAPPTPVSSDDLAKLPEFPTIEPGKEMFLDLNRGEQAVYRFDVTAPGIYRLETSGRLRTQLILRSRLQTSLATEAGNGLGRNALILDYLLPGKYQVTVRPLHRSAGHLGVSMKKSVLINGGHLTLDRDKRVRVPRNQAVTYRLEIPEAGRYWVESLGQEGYFKARLEDGDGWPILKPGLTAKIERNFKPGAYQLISLPENRENRRITRLQKLPEAAEFDGKGPHQLKLNQTITATWMEEKEEGHRKPARFRFTTPAPIPAKLFLSDEFEATLANLDHDTTLLTWSGSEAI
ncbi:MAG: hypothetical protein GWN13_28565, partial [Phycisphaerae bacterium]|nr:hypothetical protein [Phycisphaerae bacterium]